MGDDLDELANAAKTGYRPSYTRRLSSRRPSRAWMAWAVAGGILFLGLIGMLSHPSSQSGGKSGDDSISSATQIDAFVTAEGFVKDRLKAPSTADFGSVFGDYQSPKDHVQDLGGGRYDVHGWVDAQNVFGAKIRSRWNCVIRSEGEGRWRLESIEIE